MGVGIESRNGRRAEKKEIADIRNYQISSGGLTFLVEISQCPDSEHSIVEAY